MLEDHRPQWADAYARECGAIERALAPAACEVHHIGSTAVPGLLAKPVIDILLVVPDIAALHEAALVTLGYEARGEYGIAERRYFVRDDATNARRYHLHAFAAGHSAIHRHLALRDLLRADPAARERYAATKRKALATAGGNKALYQAGKDCTIRHLLAVAGCG